MSKVKGWISLYRSVRHNWIYTSEPFDKFHAFVDLIFRAQYEDAKVLIKGQLIELKKGQLLVGTDTLSKEWQWSRGKVLRFLKLLEQDEIISLDGTALGTVVTIENYSKYQDLRATDDTTDEQRTDNGRATDRQRTDITKEGKRRLKKVNNNIPPSVEEVRAYCQSRKNNVDPETFIDFYSSKDWYVGKNKMTDWRAAVRNWERSRGASKSEEIKTKKYTEYKPDEKEPERISDAEQAARVRQMRERLGGCFEKI